MAKLGFLGPRLVALLAMLAALVLAHASAAQVSTPSAAPPGDAGPATGRDRGAPSILIIGSFDRSAQSTRMQENAIRDVLDDSFPEARIRSEYLATVRGDGESNQAEVMGLLLQALRVKIGGERFDLLIIIDTLAFEALSGPGRDIIADLPVVFSGLTWDVERLAEANLNATGVFERIDVAGTVDLITTLLPSTRRVLAVSRGSPTADRFRRVAGEQLSARTGGPEIVWSEAPSIPALGREAAGLSPDSAFLFITFRDDTLGARPTRNPRAGRFRCSPSSRATFAAAWSAGGRWTPRARGGWREGSPCACSEGPGPTRSRRWSIPRIARS